MKPFSNRACLVAAFAFLILAVSLPARAGIVVAREFRSSALDRNWSYAVYLPDGYETSNLRYPVLYLLHGNGGNLYSWVNDGHIQQTADALIARGDIPPCVIVMPDAGTSWFVDRKENMETAVIGDLIPEVEKNWEVLSSRPGRLVGRVSMGGYCAIRVSLEYTEVLAGAAPLSPASFNLATPQK